jgi:hypothetical protein
MALTKAERERMAALETQLRLAKALRWPTEAPTLVEPPRGSSDEHTYGFVWGSYDGRFWVESAISSSTSHAHSSDAQAIATAAATKYKGSRVSWSQSARRLAATRRDALLAIRIEATQKAAELLARIDAEIEKESPGASSA